MTEVHSKPIQTSRHAKPIAAQKTKLSGTQKKLPCRRSETPNRQTARNTKPSDTQKSEAIMYPEKQNSQTPRPAQPEEAQEKFSRQASRKAKPAMTRKAVSDTQQSKRSKHSKLQGRQTLRIIGPASAHESEIAQQSETQIWQTQRKANNVNSCRDKSGKRPGKQSRCTPKSMANVHPQTRHPWAPRKAGREDMNLMYAQSYFLVSRDPRKIVGNS